jgi:hypothetical protein
MRVTKQDQEAVARYVAKRPKHKYGKHSYSLPPEIDVNVVRKQFAAYMQKFNVREE